MYQKLAALFKSSLAYTIGNVINRALFLFSMPIMTRYLAPEEYGALSIVNTVTAILITFSGLGLHDYAMRFYYEAQSEDERKCLLGSVSIFLVLFSLTVSLALSSLGESIFPKLFDNIPFTPCMLIGIWTSFAASFETVPDALFRVRNQALLFIGVQTTKSVLAISLSIVSVVLLHRGAEGPLAANLLVATGSIFFFLIYLRGKVQLAFSATIVREGLSFSLPVLVLLLGRVFLDSADRLFLQHFLDLSEVAFYSVGATLGSVLIMLAQSINVAWTPFYYDTARSENRDDARQVFAYASTYVTAAIVYIALVPVVFRHEIISLLAPPAYSKVIPIVPLIMLGSILSALFFIPSRAIYQSKRTGYLPALISAGLVSNVSLSLLLIPRLAILGAALAMTMSSFVMLILCFVLSQRMYHIPYQYARLGKLVPASILCYALSIPVSAYPFALALLLKLIILFLFPAILYALRFYEPREIQRLREILLTRMLPE